MSIGYNGKTSGGNDPTTTTESRGWREQSLGEPVPHSERQVHSGRKMAHPVIYHFSDENEEFRWVQGSQQPGGPVKIAFGPAPAVARPRRTELLRRWERHFYAPPAGAAPRLGWTNVWARGRVSRERMTEESFTT